MLRSRGGLRGGARRGLRGGANGSHGVAAAARRGTRSNRERRTGGDGGGGSIPVWTDGQMEKKSDGERKRQGKVAEADKCDWETQTRVEVTRAKGHHVATKK